MFSGFWSRNCTKPITISEVIGLLGLTVTYTIFRVAVFGSKVAKSRIPSDPVAGFRYFRELCKQTDNSRMIVQ